MLFNAPLPRGLSEEDQMFIREEIDKQRIPVEDKGKSFLLAALDTGHKQGSWGQFQEEALAYLAERYPKEFRAYLENSPNSPIDYAIGCGDSLKPTIHQAAASLEQKLDHCWATQRDPLDPSRGKTVLLQFTYENSGKLTLPHVRFLQGPTDDRLKSCLELAVRSSQYSQICETVVVEKTLKFGSHAL